MKIVIRCDSSLLIGTGHVARCLTLAIKLQEIGYEVSFACRDLAGNLVPIIRSQGYTVTVLPKPSEIYKTEDLYASWVEVNIDQEIRDFHEVLLKERPDWVIVDHYGIPKSWEEMVLETGVRLFVIDDLFRPHVGSAVLDQNFHFNHREKFKDIPNSMRTFLGPEYSLLSKSFTDLSPGRMVSNSCENVLAFFGGIDSPGNSLAFVERLALLPEKMKFDLVVGQNNPFLEKILEAEQKYHNLQIHVQTLRMADLMMKADIFIGAGGTTVWERAYLGLPSLCVAIAENQVPVCTNLHQAGIHYFLGKAEDISDQKFIEVFKSIAQDYTLRKRMSEKSLNLHVGSKVSEILKLFENKQ